ncbi:MAG: phosphoenolpyruvate carboxykinase (GTP), partial [Actinobacteria bacterium]|nr:phosphoenolpyruvate carboxykinase (GTP) [Actinomycetota bacterium]
DLDLDGLGITPADQEELFAVQPDSWLDECAMTDEYFNQFAGAVPAEVVAELSALKSRLMAVAN